MGTDMGTSADTGADTQVTGTNQVPSRLPALPAMVYLIGIGGIGMSGLARILAARGYQIGGSDAADSPVVAGLRAEGFNVTIGHEAANLTCGGRPDLVVMTAAAREENPEVAAARALGIPVIKRAALLGLLCDERTCVAVAGTHGKSTTSGMLALALSRAGQDPSFAVGAEVRQLGTNARPGTGPVFIAEADEYDYSFLQLHPSVAVVLNIEYDHPDLFPSQEAVQNAFWRFVTGIRPGGSLILSSDDPGCRRLRQRLRTEQPVADLHVVSFGVDPSADWRVEIGVDSADIVHTPDGRALPLRLRVPGRHNRLNAAATLAAGAALGIAPNDLLPGLEEFGGVGRRFETRGEAGGVTVIDDYAHHPTELRANLEAARGRFPGARLWAIFQPHTYTRTKALLDDFAAALSLADQVVLTAIYPARETDDLGVRSDDIAARITGAEGRVRVVGTPQEAGALVASIVRAGDVVLVFGAGDIWKASEVILGSLTP